MNRPAPLVAVFVAGVLLGLLVVFAAACGEVKGALPDAPPIADDAADASPSTPVAVTALSYLGDGLPAAGAKLVFQDPSGNEIADLAADAAGRGEAVMPDGGSVTAIRITTDTPTSLTAELTTVRGIAPGDDLTLGLRRFATVTNQGGQTTMTASFTPISGASSYTFFTECGATKVAGSPATLTLRDSCHGAMFDLIVVANGTALPAPRFIRLANVVHANGGSFTIPNQFVTMSSFAVNAAGMPAEISSLSVARSSMIASAAIANETVAAGDPPAGTVTTAVPFAPGIGTRSQVELVLRRADSPAIHRHEVHTASLGSSLDVDLGQHELPWLANLQTSKTGIAWTNVVPGDFPDGMVALWVGRWTEAGRTIQVSWRIIQAVDAAATSITLPRLPATYVALDPAAQTATVTTTVGAVTMADYDVVAGYAQFRAQADTLSDTTVERMGAFVGMPFARRLATVDDR